MASIIAKRLCLHENLAQQEQKNHDLKLKVGQLQALANLGTTTCMIAHEINNLLTPLSNYADLALNNPADAALGRKALKKTAVNCQRASKIMQSMLAVANGEAVEKKHIELYSLVDEIFTCLCRDFARDAITVNIQMPGDLTVFAVPIQIQQALMNLILNARDAMLPRGGVLTITADVRDNTVEIEVADTGCGIKTDELDRIFEIFYSTKNNEHKGSENSGFGLGLAFCKKVVDLHNGSISVRSTPNEQTSFRIVLPRPN